MYNQYITVETFCINIYIYIKFIYCLLVYLFNYLFICLFINSFRKYSQYFYIISNVKKHKTISCIISSFFQHDLLIYIYICI